MEEMISVAYCTIGSKLYFIEIGKGVYEFQLKEGKYALAEDDNKNLTLVKIEGYGYIHRSKVRKDLKLVKVIEDDWSKYYEPTKEN